MKLVIIESPFKAETPAKAFEHLEYLRAAIHDSLARSEAPFASHGFYTAFLDDENPAQRALGMKCGFEVLRRADLVAVYNDLGCSPGMRQGIDHAASLSIPVEFRSVPSWSARSGSSTNKES